MKTATEKCWLTADGKTLVADGDEKASSLFAMPGQAVDPSRLTGVANADKFVSDPNAEKPSVKDDKHRR